MSPGEVELHDREYEPPEVGLPVDIAPLDELRQRVSDAELERPGRVAFHLVILCTSGEGLHEVDFIPVGLQPGRVVHVQPGQVHRWRLARSYQAMVIFFPEDGSSDIRPEGWPIGPRWFDLTEAEQARSEHLVDLARAEYALDRPTESRDRALKGALELLMVNLRLDQVCQGDRPELPRPYLELMDQLEAGDSWSRSVKARADRLGYSTRTLTRACQAATGRSAKDVIDARIVLEARRLLTHRDNTVERVARALSFSEPSNFAKFFHRVTGENPDTWRNRHISSRS